MGSRPVGKWSNHSWMHGVTQDRMGLRSMRLVARGRMKPTSFWRAMAADGGKLVAMYGSISEGPGAMVIFEADPAVAPAIAGVAASSDGVTNVKYQRLFSGEVRAIRQKRVELQKSYRPPGK